MVNAQRSTGDDRPGDGVSTERSAPSDTDSVVPTSPCGTQTLRAVSGSVILASGMGDLRLSSPPARAPGGMRQSGAKIVAVLAIASFSVACGHPATEAECRIILERIVELELKSQKVNDPAEIAKRRSESLGLSADGGRSDLLDGCVGRHITDRALVCVQNAENASDITEHCLQ